MTQTSDDRIRGKVAAIINTRELVLNVGAEDGVQVGMKFVILSTTRVEITDPDTQEVIGMVYVPKTVVKVVRVDGAHISTARTFRTIKGSPGALTSSFASSMSGIVGTPDRPETFEVAAGSTLRSELPAEDSFVKRGDIALSTHGDEYD